MLISEAITRFLDHRSLKGIAETTMTAYRYQLTNWQRWLSARAITDVHTVKLDDMRDYLLYLKTDHIPHSGNPYRPNMPQLGLSPSSVQGAHKILSALWRYLDAEGTLHASQRGYFQDDRIPRPKVQQRARQYYSQDDIEALLLACTKQNAELRHRNQAIILLLLESGMRVTELCTLEDSQVDHARKRARIVGKGGKERWVFWHARAALALRQYVLCRTGGAHGPLIRTITGRKVERTQVYKMICSIGNQGGVKLPASPVHALRHTFAHRAIHAGIPISQLCQMMGHSSVEITMRYLMEEPEELQQAHARIGRPSSTPESADRHKMR